MLNIQNPSKPLLLHQTHMAEESEFINKIAKLLHSTRTSLAVKGTAEKFGLMIT